MQQEQLQRLQQLLGEQDYIADRSIVMSVYLAMTLRKPLLIEGPAGVGKTEIAKVMARALDTDLIRLQCYEGLDANMALYEWNYQRQLLHLKLDENKAQQIPEIDEILRRLDRNGPHTHRTTGSPISLTNTGLAVTFVNICGRSQIISPRRFERSEDASRSPPRVAKR